MSMIQTVADGVTAISLDWSNAYLLQEGANTALIDTGLRQDRERLTEALQQLGVREDRLSAVYLTHAHCDHAGNAAYLAARGARLYTHRAEARFIGLPRRSYALAGAHMLVRPLSMLAFLIGERLFPVERRHPDAQLQDGDIIDAPGGPLRVIFCPGHTPGHIAYYRERDGVLFSGDAILNIIPFVRKTALSLPVRAFSDDWARTIRSARGLAELRPKVLLAGHGWPLSENTAQNISDWAATLS